MVLKIETGEKNKILRVKSKPIEEITGDIKELVLNMKETLSTSENGIGLAAPQVGIDLQLFVIDSELAKEKQTVFINPEITKASRNKTILEEGCLSLPGQWHELGRPEKATIKAINEKGEKFKIRGKGLLARLFVHEVDHLNGTLFVDHLKK